MLMLVFGLGMGMGMIEREGCLWDRWGFLQGWVLGDGVGEG